MVATLGAKAPTGMPRWRSIRCLANVAAWAELPRALVRTKLGGSRLRQRRSSASGAASALSCRRTASGLFCQSASMLTRLSLTGIAPGQCGREPRILPHCGPIAERRRPRRREAQQDDAVWRRRAMARSTPQDRRPETGDPPRSR